MNAIRKLSGVYNQKFALLSCAGQGDRFREGLRQPPQLNSCGKLRWMVGNCVESTAPSCYTASMRIDVPEEGDEYKVPLLH